MLARSIRTRVATLAAMGLIAATALPVAGQSATPTCTVADSATEDVAEGVTLTYDSSFTCPDAADNGTWAITVAVANAADSTTGITLEEARLSHTTPLPTGEAPDASVTGGGLPLSLAAGADGTFDADGDYELSHPGDDSKVNLHVRVDGVTDDDERFTLGILVQVLGPGTDPDLDQEEGDGGAGVDSGRPDWVPGPPPWVIEMLREIFPGAFPWGTDTFPPRVEADSPDEGANEGSNQGGALEAGPPTWLELPPPASGADGGTGGPPDWVSPGGPPAWAPAGGAGDEDRRPPGAGRP